MLVNIIHPHTFKQSGNTLRGGPCEEFEDRDKRVRTYVKEALDSEARVLWHKYHNGNPINHIMGAASLKLDPIYDFLFDPRIDIVTTTPSGIPIPDKIPESIDQDLWNYFREIYTSHSGLEQKIGNPRLVIFIGGILENCIVNAAAYFHQHYKTPGQQLFYIPELCVSFDGELLAEGRSQLDEREINPIKYEDALNLLQQTPNVIH